MSQQKRHTPEDVIKDVHRLLDQGATQTQIRVRKGMSASTVKRIARKWKESKEGKSSVDDQ